MEDLNFKLSDNEKQILDTMWREERALTRSDVINLTENKTWKESSIHILLNQLLDKGAIEVEGIVKTGKTFGRTYKPTVTRQIYEEMQLKNSFEEINPSRSSIKNFFSALIESKDVDKETLEDLERLIKDSREE